MLQKINNPKSTSYLNFKDYCNSRHITWNWLEHNVEQKNNHKNATTVRPESWNDESINFGFYAHLFLIPPHPRALYSTPVDERTLEVHDIIRGILEYNGIKVDIIYRIAVQFVLPTKDEGHSVAHVDHPFPHKNLIIYLTDPEGGSTVCEGEEFLGKEDDVIIFEGEHYMYPPKKGRRMVIVATYLDHEENDTQMVT